MGKWIETMPVQTELCRWTKKTLEERLEVMRKLVRCQAATKTVTMTKWRGQIGGKLSFARVLLQLSRVALFLMVRYSRQPA